MFLLHPIRALQYQINLLQLENYNLERFFYLIKKTKGIPRHGLRQPLVWTQKLKVVVAIATVLYALVVILLTWLTFSFSTSGLAKLIGLLLVVYLLAFAFSIFLILAVTFIRPVDFYLKQRIVDAAKQKIKSFPKLKIIAIAGSYGKTTMKEILWSVLSTQFEVLKTVDSINTPLGISRLILDELESATEVLIVEMGEFARGDIRALCEITPPDISVITGVNEAHLERMGSLDNTISAIFEVARYAKADALMVMNADDDRISANHQKHVGKRPLAWYSAKSNALSDYMVTNRNFNADSLISKFSVSNKGRGAHEFQTSLLADYAIGDAIAAAIVARSLGVAEQQIASAVAGVKSIPHRLQPIVGHGGTLVIDDSYNGNPDGAREAIVVLARFKDRRKVYVTPGLVESGSKTAEVHERIGELLRPVADVVVLIRNSVTPYIAKGLDLRGFPRSNILWFDSASQAHEHMAEIIKSGDVVLFQNDWPDNYL